MPFNAAQKLNLMVALEQSTVGGQRNIALTDAIEGVFFSGVHAEVLFMADDFIRTAVRRDVEGFFRSLATIMCNSDALQGWQRTDARVHRGDEQVGNVTAFAWTHGAALYRFRQRLRPGHTLERPNLVWYFSCHRNSAVDPGYSTDPSTDHEGVIAAAFPALHARVLNALLHELD